mgnify:CR=1 FL=1
MKKISIAVLMGVLSIGGASAESGEGCSLRTASGLGKSILFTGKPLTFLQFVVEYRRYAKTMRKPSKVAAFQREGNGVSPLVSRLCEPLPCCPG